MANLVDTILTIFSEVGTWFLTILQQILGLFWDTETGLTFFGIMALIPLGISVILLVFNIVKSFLKFRN